MKRERVADNVYVFTSELYAKVNAGAVIGPEWAVVIDTLAYPKETKEIKDFIQGRLETPVRYVINTHYHADHSLGSCWFPDAIVLGNTLCRHLLDTRGRKALKVAQQQNRGLRDVRISLPDVIFDEGELGIRVGKRLLKIIHLPGHSADGAGVLLVEDRVLFSGDIMMPIPYLVDGDFDVMAETMKKVATLGIENLVQGHGEVILRGEVQSTVKDNLNYLAVIRRHVRKASRRRDPMGYLKTIDVEMCGKSRILLAGLAEDLHSRNLIGLYNQLYGDQS